MTFTAYFSASGAGVVAVDRQSLAKTSCPLWSIDSTVRYLLISGLLAELVWFTRNMGDVKTSLSVSLIILDHQTSLKHLKR